MRIELLIQTKKLNKAVTKNDGKSFKNLKKSCTAKNRKNGAQATLEVNRNIHCSLNFFLFKDGYFHEL